MRIIKFRAWDTEENKMIDWGELIGYCDIDYLFSGGELRANNEHSNFNYPIAMQFTGLLDVNAKEIYEGDIVETVNNDGQYFFSEVKYVIDAFCIGLHTLSSYEHLTVAGNIYENPELLICD